VNASGFVEFEEWTGADARPRPTNRTILDESLGRCTPAECNRLDSADHPLMVTAISR
jgi:hypothetical protein